MGIKEGQDAAIVTKNIIKAVQVPCVASVCELTVNTSIGISIYLRDGATVKALIKSAHAAMYRAKQNKSGYSFRAALHRSQPEQSVLVGDLVNEMSRPATMLRDGPQPLDRISRSLGGLSAGLVKRLDPRTLWCKPPTVSVDPVLDEASHDYRNGSILQERPVLQVSMHRP